MCFTNYRFDFTVRFIKAFKDLLKAVINNIYLLPYIQKQKDKVECSFIIEKVMPNRGAGSQKVDWPSESFGLRN